MAEYISPWDQVIIVPIDDVTTMCVCGRSVMWSVSVYEWRCKKCGRIFRKDTGMNQVYDLDGTHNGRAFFL